ncbi:hypothetical protein L6270_05430 [Candidatus Parcubacteria bacterium]|nr:hypothetical protein [Patescibacteria group bacterium]MBU4309402.1 hypothetical protein [Patescibacteria group bacterium]MBU4431975.1 hypothetical protein [Patescibacteria group bacterium]MBU4577763.1 hypothetical protein [Patescibacteria group bacterium]MCG2697448.1 hypothetical protein [Candidatus Parcubacteria bacterium]
MGSRERKIQQDFLKNLWPVMVAIISNNEERFLVVKEMVNFSKCVIGVADSQAAAWNCVLDECREMQQATWSHGVQFKDWLLEDRAMYKYELVDPDFLGMPMLWTVVVEIHKLNKSNCLAFLLKNL